MSTDLTIATVDLDGLTVSYRALGSGPPVVLLHGWPDNCVIAPDLPGFGESSKPTDATYDFEFYGGVLDGLFEAFGTDEVALCGHDIGGPIALHWALRHPGGVTAIALLNTLVYPEFSETVTRFLEACATPHLRTKLTSAASLERVLRLGLAEETALTHDVVAAVQHPFRDDGSRLALAAAGSGLGREGFEEIARCLSSMRIPVRVVYGERDRILPDIAETVARLSDDVPHAEATALPDCGHFLQEEAPVEVGELLAAFFSGQVRG